MLHPTAITILLLIIASMFVVPASASDVGITVENEQVKAKFILSLEQNMTQFPNQTSTFNLASDGALSSAFTDSLKTMNPAAEPSDLMLNLNSTKTVLKIDTTMTVSGVSERRGDILAVDMGWKSFNVSADLRAGNLSYNTIGARYFRPIAAFYTNASLRVGQPNATITGVTFLVNQTSVEGRTAEQYAGNFTIFDFRSLSVPLEAWSRTYSLSNNTTTWRYTPPQRFDLTIRFQSLNQTTDMYATYGYDAEVSISGIARAQGDIVLLDIGTGQKELIMAGIVAITIILAIVTQLLFRARKKKHIKFGRW